MFFITCFEKISKDKGFLDMGASRVFGFEDSFKNAKENLNSNSCDMHEFLYKYAIVEEMDIGIHPEVKNRWFFKWDNSRKGFFEIDEPPEFKGFCNIALG